MRKLMLVSTLLILIYHSQGQVNEKFLKLQRIITLDSVYTGTNFIQADKYFSPFSNPSLFGSNSTMLYPLFSVKVPDSVYWKVTTASLQLPGWHYGYRSLGAQCFVNNGMILHDVDNALGGFQNKSALLGLNSDKPFWVSPGSVIRFTLYGASQYVVASMYLSAEEYRLEEQ